MKCSQSYFLVGLLVTLWGTFTSTVAKEYMRCELSRELYEKHQISKTYLSNWICLVEHESKLSTNLINLDHYGSKRYGLFQINGKDWCREGRKGGRCGMKCEDLVNNDISDDVACAQKIFDTEGFKYWPGWIRSCKSQDNVPDLNVVCNIHRSRADLIARIQSNTARFHKILPNL